MPTSRNEALARLAMPRPPGNFHGIHPVSWDGERADRTVCNCAAFCRSINSDFHYGAISQAEWEAWHLAGESQSEDLDTTTDEEEDYNMSIPSTMSAPKPATFVCAHCGVTRSRHLRIIGKLEMPIMRNDKMLDRICKACAQHEYYFARINLSNPEGNSSDGNRGARWIRTRTAVHLRDLGEPVSDMFANLHCVTASDGHRFFSVSAAAEWERRSVRVRQNTLTNIRAQTGAYIFGYHEVNNVTLFGWPDITPKDSLCFGVELEMESKKAVQQIDRLSSLAAQQLGMQLSAALGGRLDDPKNRFVLARDGSLGNSGIELITNPYTLDYHQHMFGWAELLKPAIAVGACSGAHTVRCGMHVHVNRKAISPLALGKALIFVNSEANRALIERIAQRPSNTYTNLRPKKMADGRVLSTAKYEAMHLSDATVEFRIFRGNLRADRVLKNIEFCHSVFSYVATISARACQGYDAYLKFIVENGKLYPNLLAFLREKDTIAIRKGSRPQVQITEEI